MTPAEANYLAAAPALNGAAYTAMRAAKDTEALPMVNRQLLRDVARIPDAIVDAGLETAKDELK